LVKVTLSIRAALYSNQVRVQHRKLSPMDRMKVGRVRLSRVNQNVRRNGGKAIKQMVAV